VASKNVVVVSHASSWSVIALLVLTVEGILAAKLLESLAAVLLRRLGGV